MEDQPEKTYVLTDVLKKRKIDQNRSSQKAQQRIDNIKKKRSRPERTVVPIDEMIKEYRLKQTAYSKYKKRNVKTLRSNHQGDDNKLVLLVRLRGVKDISDNQKKILSSLKLYGPMCAVFTRLTTQNLNKIKRVENYITYGFPTRKLISELIFKKSFGRINGKRTAIKTNKIVEEQLGEKGLICLDDLINEIADLGENFDTVQKFLYPFKLTTPESGFNVENITKPFTNGGEWGDREQKINDLVLKMI